MPPRLLALLSLALVIPLGFALKLAGHGGSTPPSAFLRYVNNSIAGVAYEVFWCLAVFFIIPRRRAIAPICLGVLVATTALEFLQLWHPPAAHPLTAARSTFLGKALLGTTFTWLDLPHYALGCALAYLWLRLIAPTEQTQTHAP